MEPEQNTQTPIQENAFPPAVEGSNKKVFMIGGIAVVAILAGLGWYMMQSINMPTTEVAPAVATPEQQNPATTTTDQTATGTQDAATAALSTQGTSDDLGSIDADLKATDLNSLNDINKI